MALPSHNTTVITDHLPYFTDNDTQPQREDMVAHGFLSPCCEPDTRPNAGTGTEDRQVPTLTELAVQ